jgi:hypothetical protein
MGRPMPKKGTKQRPKMMPTIASNLFIASHPFCRGDAGRKNVSRTAGGMPRGLVFKPRGRLRLMTSRQPTNALGQPMVMEIYFPKRLQIPPRITPMIHIDVGSSRRGFAEVLFG